MAGLSGKRALITGGGRGIGRAIVDRFLADGAQVVTCGRGAPDDLAPAVFVTADLTRQQDIDTLVRRAVAEMGGIDILVNNAGVQIEKTVADTTDADWDLLMGVNVAAVFRLCRAVLPIMSGSGGAIINLGSISADHADPEMAIYNASKGFVHGLTRSIAVDHGAQGIRCNAVCPGWIMTEMADAGFDLAQDPAAARRDAVARTPAGRLGRPEDVANLIAWLCGDEAAFVTGQCYTVDGGLTVATPLRPTLF
ncbi:MAG: SDR family oxidoreductase [Alphaproteobacteria bacterium]|nr:SDR family oxidoreductase [Alphaproteobacteria bacterium]MBO6861705.1 SDR family oxidoreductase [Alphaproteobacteria bacterium]